MESSLQLGKVLLAISVFLTFVAWDVAKAWKRGDKWIQGSGFTLTLTALTVQFLGYFDAQNVNLFGKSKEEELQMLLNKQLSVDIARLVFCTFLGCVLPGVAFHGSGGRWSNIAALAVSLCLHMATEVYVLQNVDDPAFGNGGQTMFLSSSVLLLVAAISLVLYIGLAVVNCKFSRDRLRALIPKILSGTVNSEMLDENKGEVFKWWAVVRGCQQEFWLVSSAFTPAVLMIVTTCVAVVVAKLISRQSLLHRSNISVTVTLCLQCVFILTGWIILIWRWLIFLLLCLSRGHDFSGYPIDTLFYGIRFCRLGYLIIWNLSPLDNVSHFKCTLTNVWKGLRILVFLIFLISMFPMGLFFVMICLLLLFNIFCWGLSTLLVWSVIIVTHFIHKFRNFVPDAEVELRWPNCPERLYVAGSSKKETKAVMVKAYDKGKSYYEILKKIKGRVDENSEVIENQLSKIEEKYIYEGVWKMAAVAAISILAELAYCGHSYEILRDPVQAYREAQDLLEFLDFPDNITVNPMYLFDSGNSGAYQMSLEADIKMQKITRLVERNCHRREELTFKDVAKIVEEFALNGWSSLHPLSKFCQYWTGENGLDASNFNEGSKDLKLFSMKCVCKAIFNEPCTNQKELVDRTVSCLGDIIACAVLQVPKVIPGYCRKWAEEFKEDNLIKALEIQEKVRAIEEMLTSAEENKSPEDAKVDIEQTYTRKRELNGSERDIGLEIIYGEAK